MSRRPHGYLTTRLPVFMKSECCQRAPHYCNPQLHQFRHNPCMIDKEQVPRSGSRRRFPQFLIDGLQLCLEPCFVGLRITHDAPSTVINVPPWSEKAGPRHREPRPRCDARDTDG
jgi:hypothetical protein